MNQNIVFNINFTMKIGEIHRTELTEVCANSGLEYKTKSLLVF